MCICVDVGLCVCVYLSSKQCFAPSGPYVDIVTVMIGTLVDIG